MSPRTLAPSDTERRRRATLALLSVGLLLTTTAGALGCSADSADAAPEAANARPERPPPGVQVAIAESRPLERTVEFTGELLAEDLVLLSPQESGRLVQLGVDEGDEVEADQLIGQLDDELQHRAKREAEARLDSARARRSQAEAQRDQQANEVQRRRPLAARNAFPEAELAQLEDGVEVADQAVEVADAQVDEARAAVAAAREALERREIRSPFAGLIVERHVTQGAVVSPTTPIVTLVDEDSLHFVFTLSEQRMAMVEPGTRAVIRFDAYPDRVVSAEVWRVGRVVDRESRTVEVKLAVTPEDPDIDLRHGMFGRGELVAERLEAGVVVAPEAIQTTREGRQRVWTVSNRNSSPVAEPVDVSIALATEDAVAIEGVEPGSRVILSPPMGLTPGGPVYVVGGMPLDRSGDSAGDQANEQRSPIAPDAREGASHTGREGGQ